MVSQTTTERRHRRTRARIADTAATLAATHGVSGTTVRQIAEASDVGRATFFRYFGAKEWAIAEGFAQQWLAAVTGALAGQPVGLGPMEAVRAACAELADGFDGRAEEIRGRAQLARSHPALRAWTLLVHLEYEQAIAALVEPRFADLGPGDLRPRLVGSSTMAVIRLAVDAWLDGDGEGDLPSLIAAGLEQVEVR